MERKIRYVRKISGTEAKDNYIMVMKDSLKLFPKPGLPFKIKVGEQEYDSQIKVIDCWCMGPKKPHVHYQIDLVPMIKAFRPQYGKSVVLEKVDDNVYQLVQ